MFAEDGGGTELHAVAAHALRTCLFGRRHSCGTHAETETAEGAETDVVALGETMAYEVFEGGEHGDDVGTRQGAVLADDARDVVQIEFRACCRLGDINDAVVDGVVTGLDGVFHKEKGEGVDD